MAYSFKGGLNFGFVYIPIELHLSVRDKSIGFNMLDKKTMSRIKYVKTCVDCEDKQVDPKNIVKGYEYEKGKYVIFEPDDFEKLKSKKDESISIIQFVKSSEIDPLFYDKPYYIVPKGADKAFTLFATALEKSQKVGIAKTVLGTKETLVALRVKDGKMFINTMHFADEVEPYPKQAKKEKINAEELKMATAIINTMTKPFNIEDFVDEYRQRVEKAIETKIAGKKIVAPKEGKTQSIGDLMDALKKSLKELEKEKKNVINKPSAKTKTAQGAEK